MRSLAVITYDFAPDVGGVQTYLSEIVCRLAADYTVDVLTGVPVKGTQPEGLGRYLVPSRRFGAFWRLLRHVDPENVLVGHAHPQLLLAASLYGRPFATMVHGNDFLAAQSRWHRWLFNWLLKRSNVVLANSAANAARLATKGIEASAVVYPGTDPTRFKPAPSPPPFPPRLLTVGRLVPRKGIDTVIRALPALRDSFPQLTYAVAGDGPDRHRLEQLAAEHDVVGAIDFLGRVGGAQLPSLYREAHVFVMPVRESATGTSLEGFGIVFLEASASGLPVVAGRSGGAVEAVQEDKTGVLVNPHDHHELASVIRDLLYDSERRRRLGSCGRAWVEAEMNWERAARQIATILKLGP